MKHIEQSNAIDKEKKGTTRQKKIQQQSESIKWNYENNSTLSVSSEHVYILTV